MDKFIKTTLQLLSIDNGGAQFEFLATSIAEKEIYPNIMPSTGPYALGDKGMDSRTYESTDDKGLVNPFRLRESKPLKKTDKKIIFAYSIRKDWQTKLNEDLNTIKKNFEKFDKVCFITSQFIQVLDREAAIQKALDKKGVVLEIFDGEWLTLKLADQYYDLAVRYLGLPASSDPKIKELYESLYSFQEGGMTAEQAKRLAELNDSASYRASYDGNLDARVNDLHEAGHICINYSDYIEKAETYFKEALSEKDNVNDKWLIAEVYYDYFRALQKLKNHKAITDRLPEYATYLVDHQLVSKTKIIFTWCFFLAPHQDDFDLDIVDFAKQMLEKIEEIDVQSLSLHIQAEHAEAVLWAKTFLQQVGEIDVNVLKLWRKHIQTYKKIPLYPLYKLSKVVSSFAMVYEGEKDYNDLFNLIQRILLSRNSTLDAAQMIKDRAVSLYQVKNYKDAAHYLNEVKIKWYDSETLRGSILTSFILHDIYRKLGLYQAATYELLTVLHLSTIDKEIADEQGDLFVRGLIDLFYTYLQSGQYGTAIIFGVFANKAIGAHDPNLEDIHNEDFYERFETIALIMLSKLKAIAPDLHDRIYAFLTKNGVPAAELYRSFLIEDDEEFKKDFEQDPPGTYENALVIRKSIKEGKLPIIEDSREPFDESSKQFVIMWTYEGVSFTVEIQNTYEGKLVAEYIASSLQILCVELFRQDPTWIEEEVKIPILLHQDSFKIRENEESLTAEILLNLTDENYKQLTRTPFSAVRDVEIGLLSELLRICTIDSDQDMKGLINKMGKDNVFQNLSARLPFGSPFLIFYSKEDHDGVINGDKH